MIFGKLFCLFVFWISFILILMLLIFILTEPLFCHAGSGASPGAGCGATCQLGFLPFSGLSRSTAELFQVRTLQTLSSEAQQTPISWKGSPRGRDYGIA